MFTFTNTSGAKPSFRFSYSGSLVAFSFDVIDPTAIGLESYQDLSNAVLTVKNGKTKPRYFSFREANDYQYIKLNSIDDLLIDVKFCLYSVDHTVKIGLPFQICEQAFKDAAAWRATINDNSD